jgi:hypothetical protein
VIFITSDINLTVEGEFQVALWPFIGDQPTQTWNGTFKMQPLQSVQVLRIPLQDSLFNGKKRADLFFTMKAVSGNLI